MRRVVTTVVVAFFGTLVSPSAVVSQAVRLPRFEDYRVATKSVRKPARPNLRTDPNGRLFRTNLRRTAAEGPNFAGQFSLAVWGCGSDCEMVGVIDAITGRVHIPRFIVWEPSFRRDSRLLISNESEIGRYLEGEPMFAMYEPHWYVWRRGRFIEIYRKQAARMREKNQPGWYEKHP